MLEKYQMLLVFYLKRYIDLFIKNGFIVIRSFKMSYTYTY